MKIKLEKKVNELKFINYLITERKNWEWIACVAPIFVSSSCDSMIIPFAFYDHERVIFLLSFSYCIHFTDCNFVPWYSENEIKFLIYFCVKRIMRMEKKKKTKQQDIACVAAAATAAECVWPIEKQCSLDSMMTIENFHFGPWTNFGTHDLTIVVFIHMSQTWRSGIKSRKWSHINLTQTITVWLNAFWYGHNNQHF